MEGGEDAKAALFSAVSRALESYERGAVNPQHFSALLEQLQLVLEQALTDVPGAKEHDQDGKEHGHMETLYRAGGAFGKSTAGSPGGLSTEGTSSSWTSPLRAAAGAALHGGQPSGKQPSASPAGRWLARQTHHKEAQELRRENAALKQRVSELGDAEARMEAQARELEFARERAGPDAPRSVQEQQLLTRLGQIQAANDSLKQQLADSRAEAAAAGRAHAAGASRAEVVLMGELEQHRQAAAAARRDLARQAAAAAREKEAMEHEARRWQLAASQAAAVAEKTQQKVASVEQKLEAQVAQVRSMATDLAARGRELGALQQQLTASRAALAARNRYLERLDAAVLQPLLSWHAEADPAVAAALLIAGGSVGSGPAPGRGLPRSRDFVQLKFRAEAILGAAAADVDSAAKRHAAAAAAAFEALAARITSLKQEVESCSAAARSQIAEAEARMGRSLEEVRASAAQQVRTVQDQLQSTLEAKAQLREALAAEQATAAVRTSELARLSEREVRLALQVEALGAELAKLKAETSRALKDQEAEAEATQKQRAEAAFERGRQLGDRQAAATVTALKGELQDAAMQLQASRKEVAMLTSQLEEARSAAESFEARLSDARQEAHKARVESEERLRRDADCRLAEAKASAERRAQLELQDHALALQRERERGERALADAKRAGELAVEAARREGELLLQRAAGEAEMQLRAAMSQAASQLKLTEERHLLATQDAERRISALSEELRLANDKAAATQEKCEQLIAQVYNVTQELQKVRQALSDQEAAATAAAQDQASTIAELQFKLLECRQRLAAQAEQLEQITQRQEDAQVHELEAARLAMEHMAAERDDLQAECVALTQQLSSAQAAAAGVEVEMDTLTRALEAHKAARAAAEAAAEEARRSAAAAAEAAEEGAARVTALQQQLGEQQRLHEREIGLLDARCQAELESAKARYRAELEGLQSGLKLLRLKQSRVMAYVEDVFQEEQEQLEQQHHNHNQQDRGGGTWAAGLKGGEEGQLQEQQQRSRPGRTLGPASRQPGGPRRGADEGPDEGKVGHAGALGVGWRDAGAERPPRHTLWQGDRRSVVRNDEQSTDGEDEW
ncbi:hypothetical protein HYH02_013568 [Chlamydomonas schloesseri]|uniref:Uncharacterized protein n=1 Tax=Chlamydomonas schloesseri TaxID=2026947 RepID=A0A835SVQ0_9CHLO|nr:hypothetical protein HYH02_013568 [Chlamydomonas schloesseri]|eukprot:KAG2430728.1 hypothetical protein HYH02_013568 [Chlamydomonas schloesseri]